MNAIATQSSESIDPKVGNIVCLSRPYRVWIDGVETPLTIGRVVEVLNGGRCVGVEFDNYANVCDFGVSLLAWCVSNDVEAHYKQHENCPRCGGDGEIPDRSSPDGGTRLCPGPIRAA